MHGFGVTEALAGLPDWVAALFAVLTQLGDAWFLFAGVSLLYWRADERFVADPRRVGATMLALGVCALATTVALKSLFAVHRPVGAGTAIPPGWLPEALDAVYRSISTGDGFGFPSGHATGSTIVYGGAALLYDRLGSRRTRFAGAAVVILLISLSRLVIGVHLLPDVLAGMAAGSVVLLTTLQVADRRPDSTFLVGAGIAVVGLAIALMGGHMGEATKAAIGIGAGVGGFAEWRRGGDADRTGASDEGDADRTGASDEGDADRTGASDDGAARRVQVPPLVALVGLPVLGGIWGGVYAAEPPLPLAALGSGIAVAGIVAVPRLVVWWRERE
ncbi:MAG: phosphatase PAP2 family protein [Halolamina sp.]